MRAARILVAEDDGHIRQGLVDSLESEGYAVVAAGDGAAALSAFRTEAPDLVLLDVMMPAKSGYDVCREIRREDARTPILMLTAKGEEIDKVVGLELGADDYITKPFGVRELLARVAAALRRSRQASAPPPAGAEPLPDSFLLGAARVDRKRYEVRLGDRLSRVTPREMELLELFCRHPGAVLSRDRLLNALWGVDYEGTTRTLDQHVAQLRKKVEPEPAAPRVIVTVHGIGYRYDG